MRVCHLARTLPFDEGLKLRKDVIASIAICKMLTCINYNINTRVIDELESIRTRTVLSPYVAGSKTILLLY